MTLKFSTITTKTSTCLSSFTKRTGRIIKYKLGNFGTHFSKRVKRVFPKHKKLSCIPYNDSLDVQHVANSIQTYSEIPNQLLEIDSSDLGPETTILEQPSTELPTPSIDEIIIQNFNTILDFEPISTPFEEATITEKVLNIQNFNLIPSKRLYRKPQLITEIGISGAGMSEDRGYALIRDPESRKDDIQIENNFKGLSMVDEENIDIKRGKGETQVEEPTLIDIDCKVEREVNVKIEHDETKYSDLTIGNPESDSQVVGINSSENTANHIQRATTIDITPTISRRVFADPFLKYLGEQKYNYLKVHDDEVNEASSQLVCNATIIQETGNILRGILKKNNASRDCSKERKSVSFGKVSFQYPDEDGREIEEDEETLAAINLMNLFSKQEEVEASNCLLITENSNFGAGILCY